MTDDVVTSAAGTGPTTYLEFRNGRLAVVQIGRVSDADEVVVLAALRQRLSDALKQHRLDLVRSIDTVALGPANPAREEALRFVAEQLEAAQDAEPIAPAGGFPVGLADGRDATRYIHVAIAGSEVVVLEAPPGTLADRRAGDGIIEAFNQALDRIDDDLKQLSDQQDEDAPLDWDGVVRDIRRLRQGY